MPRIGITGHMNLTPASVALVDEALREALGPYAGDDLVGVSCIARGADSIFAQAVLDLGGTLEVVLPTSSYRDQKVEPDHAPHFDELMRRAATVRMLLFAETNPEAYEAANQALVSSCDLLFAVWDSRTGDKGGTASVIDYARSQGVAVHVVWPDGAARG